MSEYEYDNEDTTWEDLQARYDTSPVETTAQLAQHYAREAAAQYAVSPEYIATQAMLQMQQLQANAEVVQQQEREAQDIDRSMAAEYGRSWADHSAYVGERLAGDEKLQKEWEARPSTHDRLQLIDRIYREVKTERDPDRAEWNKVKSVGRDREYWRVADDILGRG